MKESVKKTSTRAQSGKSTGDCKTPKTTARVTSSTRSSATSSRIASTGRASHNNNPLGHNQYTKK